MGLADWFSQFCQNLVISKSSDISNRYCRFTQRLNTDFWSTTSDSAHSLYTGSYGRNTAIEGVSDLDMLFQLPYELYVQYNTHSGNGQSALLQAVRASQRLCGEALSAEERARRMREIFGRRQKKKAKTGSRLRRSLKLKEPRNCFELEVTGKAWRGAGTTKVVDVGN